MSWNPLVGSWSRETFDTTTGNSLYQGIVGGHVTLLPIVNRVTGYLDRWSYVSNWTVDNGLSSLAEITGDFTLKTGAVYLGQNPVSGSQSGVFNAGAWRIFTAYPRLTGSVYSGQVSQALALETGSPDTSWNAYFSGGGTKATIEIDLASYAQVSGRSSLSGYSSSQNNISGLAPISSGFINHGIYIDTDTYWEYIEVSPYGLRLLNHPEVALPLDLSIPQRVRVVVNGQNLFLSDNNGNTVAGITKLDTASVSTGVSTAKIAFGAPPITGGQYYLYTRNISGVVGDTYWDNIKVLTGQALIDLPSGRADRYSTSTQTLFTEVFDPSIGISEFSSAIIYFTEYQLGSSVVTAQYSGAAGWVDSSSSIELVGQTSPYSLSLTNIPVSSYKDNNTSLPGINNPLRFKISQSSNGVSPSPQIEEIQVICNKSLSLLDIYPTWKPANSPTKINLGIDASLHRSYRPLQDTWSTLLINVPNSTGLFTGIDSVPFGKHFTCQGEIVLGGRFGHILNNHQFTYSTATTGSDAEIQLGSDPVLNLFYNPDLDEGYYNAMTSPFSITGRTNGYIAGGLNISHTYTGNAIVSFLKKPTYRPAYRARNASQSTTISEFTQEVYVPPGTCHHYDGTEGIVVHIPSGICPSDILFSADIQLMKGNQLTVYATGTNVTPVSTLVYANSTGIYNVSLPIIVTNNAAVDIGITVPSGTAGSVEYDFYIDNVSCTPYSLSFLRANNHSGNFNHSTGLPRYSSILDNTVPVRTHDTVFSTDLVVYSYPTGSAGILFEKYRNVDSRGLSIALNTSGYVVATYDLTAESRLGFSGSSNRISETFTRKTITGASRIPLGEVVNVSFVHKASAYSGMHWAEYPTGVGPHNFASSNRSYLMLNGYLVGSNDDMTEWKRYNSSSNDAVPYVSYIPDGTGSVTLVSGFFAGVDAISLKNPPIADAEVEGEILAAKSIPYFVPDKFFKPNITVNNSLAPSVYPFFGANLSVSSIYNLYGAGNTNWDHGPSSNHLIFYGNVYGSDSGGPYEGLGFTRFYQGSYGQAPYSSSFDRLFNTTGNLGLVFNTLTTGWFNQGCMELMGWIRPYNTGTFFYMLEDQTNIAGGRFTIGINGSSRIVASRVASNGVTAWSFTGSNVALPSGQWSWVRALCSLNNYTGLGSTGVRYLQFQDLSGNQDIASTATGANYGFQYYGRSGDAKSSSLVLGYGMTVDLCDWAVMHGNLSYPRSFQYNGETIASSNKGGRYTTLTINSQPFTGSVTWDSLNVGTAYMPASYTGSKLLMVGTHNSFDNSPAFNGGVNLLDDEPFLEVGGYALNYNKDMLDALIGATDSPIHLGYTVPDGAVNLAKLTVPVHTVASSINTFDLSDYKGQDINTNIETYQIERNGGRVSSSSISGSYNGINQYLMLGRADIQMSGQLDSKDVLVTSISITDPRLDYPLEAYYMYLVGRGEYGVYIRDSFPHSTGQLTASATGSSVTDYLYNLQSVKKNLTTLDSSNARVQFIDYPFDVVTSPFMASDLYSATQSGTSIAVDGIDYLSGSFTSKLPDGVFSVIMLLPSIPEKTIWVSYPSYNFLTKEITNRTEIINPINIMREASSTPVVGTFGISMNENTYQDYTLTVYGVDGGYSGVI